MKIRTLLNMQSSLIWTAVFVWLLCYCTMPAGQNQSTGKKSRYHNPSGVQLDSAFTEVYPLKGVEGILDTNVVVVGDGPEKQAQYQASLARLDGLVAKIGRQVIKYDQQPVCWVEIDKSGFHMVLLEVNNIPLAYAYTGQQEFRIDLINPYIETSGEQGLRIRAYTTRGYFFRSGDRMPTVRIGYSPDKRQGDAEPKYLTDYITLPDSILDTGTQYWDTTITFQAQVPWDYSDRLARATDLRTLPNLEEQVLKKYEQLRQNFIDCDVTEIVRQSSGKVKREYETNYIASGALMLNDIKRDLTIYAPNHPDKVVYPISYYELALYKDGKLVQLRGRENKKGALRTVEYNTNFQEEPFDVNHNFLLYLPEGATELQVY